MKLQWYTRREGSEVEKGPFTRAALKEAVKDGTIPGDTPLRRSDQTEWSSLQNHPAFRAGGRRGAQAAGGGAEEEKPAIDGKASPRLWFATIATFAILVTMYRAYTPGSGLSGSDEVAVFAGQVLGMAIIPLAVVGVSSLQKKNRTQQTLVKVFFFTALTMLVLSVSVGALFVVQFRPDTPHHGRT